jgi:type IV secretory pathway protease TraF
MNSVILSFPVSFSALLLVCSPLRRFFAGAWSTRTYLDIKLYQVEKVVLFNDNPGQDTKL